ncbi:MAG: arylesterase, partial [Oscillospiraceae bacterium]|nr:arylesterase [Oscillospiraceae bacterium]
MKRILCFGDSNTYGYDPRSYFGSQYPADVRWTGLLQTMGWEVANCGQNGLCIPREAQFPAVADLLRRVPAEV